MTEVLADSVQFLEPKREQIEQYVRPIDTVRSTIHFEKEYE